jgi:hypothetical protein
MIIIDMFCKREFLDDSSSSEDISTTQSNPTNRSSDVHETIPVNVIPKPPSTRPISANARIISIQRAKLLNRGKDSVRVETSPFFRSSPSNFPPINDPQIIRAESIFEGSKTEAKSNLLKNEDLKVDEIEEIKINDFVQVKEKTPVKSFLRPESPERIDPSIRKTESRNSEITPEPRYQRMTVQPNRGLRERPTSHQSQRRQSEFKTVTTVSIKKLSNSSLSISPDFKTSAFLPVPQGSSLQIVINKVKDEVSKKSSEFTVKLMSTGLLMFSGKRRKSGNFLFSLKENEFSKKSENFLGRISKNDRVFRFFDFGTKVKSGENGRKQYGTCVYVRNI